MWEWHYSSRRNPVRKKFISPRLFSLYNMSPKIQADWLYWIAPYWWTVLLASLWKKNTRKLYAQNRGLYAQRCWINKHKLFIFFVVFAKRVKDIPHVHTQNIYFWHLEQSHTLLLCLLMLKIDNWINIRCSSANK